MKLEAVVCYSLSFPDQEPMAYLRLIAPFRQAGIRLIDGLQNGRAVPDRVIEGDVVIIQRQFPQRFDEYQEVVRIARQEQKPIVFDLDDLLFFLPEDHPDRIEHSFAPALLPTFQALLEADVVTVSTHRLRNVLVDYNDRVVVLPNYFDDTLWDLKPPQPKNRREESLIIGYMGTNSHKPDLEYIAPILLDLIERFPQKIFMNFWGTPPPPAFRSLPQVQWIPFGIRSYPEFATWFQTQSADIFVAPLVDNLFNRCKSPLKFFEYSALGVPGVFSRLDPYEGVIRHGHDGFLAATLSEWEECIRSLVEDESLRVRIAAEAQATIKENWLLSQNISRWIETFQTAVRIGEKGPARERNPELELLSSINQQLFEAFQALTAQVTEQHQTIQALTAQVTEQHQTIQRLESEILGYVLSRSWRMTRPFRIIARMLGRRVRR